MRARARIPLRSSPLVSALLRPARLLVGRLLKFYALRQASEALAPTEEVEKARLTQLTFEGLTLELTTIELGPEPAFGGRLERKVWSTSVLFEEPCNCPEEVEEELIQMFSEERAPDRSQDFVDVGQH